MARHAQLPPSLPGVFRCASAPSPSQSYMGMMALSATEPSAARSSAVRAAAVFTAATSLAVGLQVSYTLCNGRVSCVLHRTVRADGKLWRITMSAPLAGNLLPEERMSARERELCREDLNHDFLSGVYNRRYLETVIAAELDRWAEQGRKAAVALISLDHGAQLRDTYGQPVMDQLICFVANQWKKYFDIPGSQIVCRLTGTTFVVGCLDMDGGQLAEQMRNIYAEMPHECVTSMGMMKRVPFTLSVAVAGLDELDSAANCWQRLYAICDERLRGIQISGGDKIC